MYMFLAKLAQKSATIFLSTVPSLAINRYALSLDIKEQVGVCIETDFDDTRL